MIFLLDIYMKKNVPIRFLFLTKKDFFDQVWYDMMDMYAQRLGMLEHRRELKNNQ